MLGKHLMAIGLAALALLTAGSAHTGDGRVTVKDVGFASPSAVRHEPHADLYLISNINGPPLSRDNNGFISRLSPDGTLQSLKWIAGGKGEVTLHAPKGMTLNRGRLYVADIDVVRVFDAVSGAPLKTVAIPGAISLTDVAVTPDGRLIVSDIGRNMATGTLFQIDAGDKVKVMARGDHLLRPNALTVRGDGKILYAPLVGEIVLTVGDDGEISDLRTYPRTVVPNWPARSPGRLSGVVMLDGATALVASKEAQTVARVRLDGPSAMGQMVPFEEKAREALGIRTEQERRRQQAAPESEFVLRNLHDPARIDIDRRRSRLLVPEVSANAVVFAPLSSVAATQRGG